jgi:AcrR family transcriptional regulator
MMAHRQTEPLWADAQQNRARILAVAVGAFTESSTASLNSIAKKAGVGIGTLYRHFPTRDALVLEVYRHEVQQLGCCWRPCRPSTHYGRGWIAQRTTG